MQYNVVKNADLIIKKSPYVVQNASKYKNRWHELFKNNNPIHLELGMGRGDSIIHMAMKEPNVNFIGVELYASQIVSAVVQLKRFNLNNLKLICMDAMDIDKVFGREIDTIYLTFSEPWPKPQDEKKRFTSPVYLKKYDKIFKRRKHIILKTDNRGLFAYSLESLSKYWYTFNTVSLNLHKDERHIPNIMTDFEQNYRKEGRTIYYLDAYYED